jgi:hypothetical protein
MPGSTPATNGTPDLLLVYLSNVGDFHRDINFICSLSNSGSHMVAYIVVAYNLHLKNYTSPDSRITGSFDLSQVQLWTEQF